MRNKICVLITVIAASCVAQADTVFSSQSAWDASVSGITTVNFEGIVGVDSYSDVTPSTAVGGVTFAVGPDAPSGAALFIIGDDFYGFGQAVVSEQSASGTLDLQVTLPSSVTAVGFTYFEDPGTYTITLSDGTSSTETATSTPQELFYGVTAPGGISSFDITIPDSLGTESINLASLSYATANPSAVPEPSSLLFTGGMLLGFIGLVARRKDPK